MTNRIIDADALLEWIKEIREDEGKTMQVTEMIFQGYSRTVPYISSSALKNKINELATPAPEPQESIFDADGWGSMYDVPKNIGIEIMVNNNTIIKAKFDADLNICTDYDVNKIKVLNKWRPMPTLPKI